MSSILRLGSKDRSSFPFKKTTQHNPDDTSVDLLSATDPLDGPLPDIAHLDTRSFVGLFDRYQTSNQSRLLGEPPYDLASNAKDFAWPVASPLHSSSNILRPQMDSKRGSANPVLRQANKSTRIMRNDSTGSSSLSLSGRSDGSAPLTRNSSSSSVMQASSPSPKRSHQLKAKEMTASQDFEKGLTTLHKLKSRASTWGPSTSNRSAPNLDKPLPSILKNGSQARRENTYPPLTARASQPSAPSKYPSLRKHNRSTSLTFPLPSTSESTTPEFSASSSRTSRGARLGRAMVDPGPRLRSKSATLLDGITFRPNTEEFTRLQQASTPSTPCAPIFSSHNAGKKQSKSISTRTAEHVIYRIMCHLDNVRDLQAAAMVSKGFLNTYQRNESKIVSHLIFQNSRPAWELRRSILTLRGSKKFRLNDYRRDSRTVKALKAFILEHCSSSLKPKTIAGLAAQDALREAEVDNALWRIWTFCALFGNDTTQNPVPAAEIDWLNGSSGTRSKVLGAGFAVGNMTGLTADELEDMMEMWTSLQGLLAQFHGREDEAKRVGIFDNWHPNGTDSRQRHLEEWTAYLMTLGPQVVLSLSSGSFDRAKMFGLNHWPLPPFGQSRSLFLASAISHVYQERILAEATAKAARTTLPPISNHRPSRSVDDQNTQTFTIRQQSLRLDTSIAHRRPLSVSAPRTAAPTEIRPDCDPTSTTIPPAPRGLLFPASPTADPTFFHTLSMTVTASTKLGATLFPIDYANQSPRVPFPAAPTRAPPPIPGIIDPTDTAMHLLVQQLGFKENNAKRALAMCETGSGIDVQKAIELLMVESTKSPTTSNTPVELPTPIDAPSSLRRKKTRRDTCSGECRRDATMSLNTSAVQSRVGSIYSKHTRSKSSGTPTDDVPISPITDIYGGHSDDDASEIRREELDMVSPLMNTPIVSSIRRMGTKRAWKILGVTEQDPLPQRPLPDVKMGRTRSKSQVVGMEEYEKRIEKRKSQRLMQQAQQQERGFLKAGLGENLKGLGLGGLGGLRIVEREVPGRGKGRVRSDGYMPNTP